MQFRGAVNVNDSLISGNDAENGGGLSALYSDFTMRDSVVSGNTATSAAGGVGIADLYGNAALYVEGSTISNNSSGQVGGGLYAIGGTISLVQSTISGNTAAGAFGGAALGAISFATVVNSTISGNTADSAAGLSIFGSAQARIAFTTITDNQAVSNAGGLYVELATPLLLQASIVAGNTAAVNPDLVALDNNGSDVIQSQFSLVGTAPSVGTLDNDPESAALLGENPLLGPLFDNGGFTLTHRPQIGSPVLDRVPVLTLGCATLVPVDQVGNDRPGLGICDIGSLEIQRSLAPPLPEATPVPTLTNWTLALLGALVGGLGVMASRRRRTVMER